MAYKIAMSITFDCECGEHLEAWFSDDVEECPEDAVHCRCGRGYLVARPYIIESAEAKERFGK